MSYHNEEAEEGDNNNNDCFYESLDRLASSSSCSCSASNSDYDSESSPRISSSAASHDPEEEESNGVGRRRRYPFPVPRFPMGASKFDVWISEPASVSERRSKLLNQMGLSRDPVLSRLKPGSKETGASSDISRSISFNHLARRECSETVGGCASCIVRSKSDITTSQCSDRYLSHGNSCSCSVTSTLSVHHPSHSEISRTSPSFVNCSLGSGSSDSSMLCENSTGSLRLNGDSECVLSESVVNENVEACTIKDLDNGKEFVVNEIQEDGTWKKVKEVGTGTQMTMEEFEMCVGHSPIVQELMRRQNVEDSDKNTSKENEDSGNSSNKDNASKSKKKGSWFKSIKSVASSMTGHSKERRSSDDRDTSSERGGRRSSSATDDSQESSFHGPERVRVKQYGKSSKELTALYKTQEIQAHNGSIWSIKFSLDGKYLASAGEDCVIHIWQVVEGEKKGELLLDRPELLLLANNGSPEPTTMSPRRRGRTSLSRKSLSLDNIYVPDSLFGLSEKPFCSFQGHVDDVLDLAWSKSQHLLSSSMDKTVRLWHLSSQTCLKVFSHSDYVTCIQFNPVDDRYFISGSLDAKVRVWSIPDRQVVDWYDLHEMVTSACYTPDGQGALVGSYKGSCRMYSASDNKLQQKSQINLQNKKKKAHQKKITGFQFVPGSSSEVLVTSSDSRIRVVDGTDLVNKLKGFRNTSSQISASITADGKYVVSASEDSHVYIWKYESPASRPSKSNNNKNVAVTNSYEHFHSQDVSAAISWPGMASTENWGTQNRAGGFNNGNTNNLDNVSTANHPPTPVEQPGNLDRGNSPRNGIISSATNGYFFDRMSATWPEEKLLFARNRSGNRLSTDLSSNGVVGNSGNVSASWGMVIVTAGLRGEIRTFQNFGLPIRI
ncbi:PREDICTED: WD repeat-containing protein 44-like [Camelina sativa]|uniref:WD repeat-containing protein 44-like n=1 Tax=Camelina sativa TaxID=90675 RepID=A0ABM0W4D5_CAMSA|nr:PREDICTED: WD repeat-containing protein 44-like [Camelina sativa]